MTENEIDNWLSTVLPKHKKLTASVITIVENLLKSSNIEYLAVTGRTKSIDSIKDKIKRKSYRNPSRQLTDLSGVRIIVFFESDVTKVSAIIESAFNIDQDNSLDKNAFMATDQIGYRSIHYVCDLGAGRAALPEFTNLEALKFEFQVRTVLQHAWAELAHDRNYKFSGKLPKDIERELYLYAGMLEIADKGFDELSSKIDNYIADIEVRAQDDDFDTEINSISLEKFVEEWAKKAGFPLNEPSLKDDYGDLVSELDDFGINRISELKAIIPDEYVEKALAREYSTTIHGLVRDWMLIKDYAFYRNNVSYTWSGFDPEGDEIYVDFFSPQELKELYSLFN